MLRRIVSTPWFARADLLLVLLGGGLWMLKSDVGILPVLAVALAPWVIRLSAGLFPFRRTSFDWLVLLFLGTAWLGYWVAYDQQTAWSKIWFVILSALLYYALAGQPSENRAWVCVLFFCIGVGISIYFFLTHDFLVSPRKVEIVNQIGYWLMEVRPQLGWAIINPNYVAGLTAITTPFIVYPASEAVERNKGIPIVLLVLIALGLALAMLAILMATSRGIIMAVACVCAVRIIFWILDRNHNWLRLRSTIVPPVLVLVCLALVVLFLYMGPANQGYGSADSPYSTGSRAELLEGGVYIATDFPFTGGGLGAFPGLYAYYMLGIPFFYVINSHNLFLDVAIEQGVLGGLSFLILFLISIWSAVKHIVKADSSRSQLFGWLILSALIIAFVHGMVDDYLYNGSSTMLALALAGLSSGIQRRPAPMLAQKNRRIVSVLPLALLLFVLINMDAFRAAWFANLGAVQMAKVELAGFPMNEWTDPAIVSELDEANATLHSALRVDSMNQTANYRLGLISMLRGDFSSASGFLERAHVAAPNHRGVIKSLGYCYVWLGEIEKAQDLLRNIPEAEYELDVYVWWWDTQGRHDLSANASQQLIQLRTQNNQP